MKKRSTKQILENNLTRKSPLKDHFILWLHNIRSLHNVGAAFRSADAFGIKEVWLSGYTPIPPRPEITKTAIGAEEHVTWLQVTDVKLCAEQLKSNGYKIIGLEQAHNSELIDEHTPESDKICLVLGNEVTGISDDMLPFIDTAVEIPQFGMKHSLNVSVAGGVALYAYFQKFKTKKRD